MKTFTFPSSSSAQVYTTRINDNGLLSCDCRGWTTKRLNKPRECKHTKTVSTGMSVVERGGQMYVVDAKTAPAVPIPIPATVSRPRADGQFITPMLASAMPEGRTADSYTYREGFVMEEKFDGIRLIVRTGSGAARAWSRLGNERAVTAPVHDQLAQLPEGVYDGELILPTSLRSAGGERLVLFDCLEISGRSLMKESQATRREFLEVAVSALAAGATMPVSMARQTAPSMAAVRVIWERGGEGAIIKQQAARYTPGWRSPDWIKVKATASATLTIIGFTAGKNGPYATIDLRDDQGIETSVKSLDNDTMREFASRPKDFIGRRLVIAYQEKLPSGKYRHPMFDHFAGAGE